METLKGFGQAGHVQVTLTAAVESATVLTDEARARIQYVLTREANRFAEITLVNHNDQQAARELEKERREHPLDPKRSHIVVAAGNRDAVEAGTLAIDQAIQVLRGEIKVDHPTKGAMTLRAPKGSR